MFGFNDKKKIAELENEVDYLRGCLEYERRKEQHPNELIKPAPLKSEIIWRP